jgi:branched-subunit amino acid aminotransferase/4-amino-4-deoxychorismate lyase
MHMNFHLCATPEALVRALGEPGAIHPFTTLASRYASRGGFELVAFDRHVFRLLSTLQAIYPESYPPECSLIELEQELYKQLRSVASLSSERTRIKLAGSPEGIAILVQPYRAPWQPDAAIALCSYAGERERPEHKLNLSSDISHTARNAALQQGAQEALLVSHDGVVREGAWSNFFWIDRDRKALVTPSTRCLPGITRALILELAQGVLPVFVEDCSLAQILDSAIEACITQATTGITAVASIDGIQMQGAKSQSIVSLLQERYTALQGVLL